MTLINRLMRSPEDNGGGTTSVPPTMDDILKGGDGSPQLPDITNPENTAKPEEKQEEPKKEEESRKEGEDEKSEEEKDAKQSDGDSEEKGEEDDEDQSLEFYQVVENSTGIKLEVEYPNGVSPLTPAGVAVRETALWNTAMATLDSNLKKEFPRGYAFIQHLQSGGTEEQFFDQGRHSYKLPTAEELAESADIQSQVFRQDLITKGLDADSIEALLQKAIKENKLLEKSQQAYTVMDAAQKKALADIAEAAKVAEQERIRAVTGMTGQIKETLDNFGFSIPKGDREAFDTYIKDKLEYDEQNKIFYLVQPVDPKELKMQLSSLFYQFKKGDLNALITKRAETKAAQTLKLKLDSAKSGGIRQSGEENTQKKPLTLGEIIV